MDQLLLTSVKPEGYRSNSIHLFSLSVIQMARRSHQLLICFLAFLMLSTFAAQLNGQSNTCIPGMVMNGATDPWSEECYLNDDCEEQGNPCTANDVTLVGVFIADSTGGPVPACTIGDTVDVLLWGTFMNNTGTNRYAIRSRVEVFINGVFNVELNTCSFDVLAPGSSDAALIGTFEYVCGQQVSIVNTWVGWSTTASQCSNPGGANYNNVCNEYPPSKCSKDFGEIIFLTPNFSYDCGSITDTTTEVCFTNLTFGGTPPLSYLWEFGDGDTSTLENPCHTYMATTGSFMVVLTVTDSNGIMAGVQLTLNLDSLNCCNLTIQCPSADGGTFECVEDVPDPDPGLITVIDSCSTTTITSVDSISGTGCGLDTMFITRYYIVADSVNTDSCIQVFKVVDDIAPVITACPADVTVECDNLVPDSDITLVTATDNCAGTVTITFGGDVLSDSTCANRYTLTRTYIATDACNNSSTCDQVITVFDDTPPTFTFVPANTTVNCDDPPVFGTPTATDNCGGVVAITFTDSSAPTANCAGGTATRLWTATDVCGNTATASQTLTLVDTEPPMFTSDPADVTIQCDSVPVFGTVTVIDNCDSMVSLDSTTTTAPTVNCAGGTTTRTWTATDNCGNTSTASQTFTFVDTEAPIFTFVPADATITCSTTPVFGTPVATDNCDTSVALDSVTTSETISNCAGGSITRTWTATDNCGNTATASQTLTYTDLVAPTIFCPADVTIECDESSLPANTGTATSTDDCGGTPVVTFSDVTVASMTCAQEYSIFRTWLATDDCANTATCIQTIIVDDSTPPDLTCPPDVTVDCEDSTAPDSTGVATATDNCDMAPVVNFSDVTVQGICPQEFTVTRTWTATDDCGNSTACVQVIMVQDTTPPTFNPDCQAEFTFFTSEGSDCPAEAEVSLEVGQVVGEAETWVVGGNEIPGLNGCLFDNCGDPDSLEARVDSIIYDGDNCSVAITIYFTILNECDTNDVNLFISVVSIIDDQAPTISCPADITINCDDSSDPANTGTATATDNCQLVGITSTDSIASGSCPQEFIIFRTWQADDSCGNASTCVQTIMVQDTTPPTFAPTCQAVFHFYTSLGSDCPAESVISIMEGDTVGENENWIVGGNTIPSLNGCLFDNCTNPDSLIARVDSVGITGDSCERTFTVLFTIIDQCGNESVDQFECIVIIHDDEAPVITCPADVTINCEDSTSPDSTGVATAIDSCQLDVAITWADMIVPGVCPNEMTILRTWTADDSCGNLSTCLQTITVQDTTPPVATFIPPDVTVECDANIDSILAEVPIFMDNCDPDVPALGSIEVIFNEACPQAPTYIQAWTGVDTCGNSTTVGRTVVVIDTTAPELTCPSDLTINCGESTSPDSTGTATATDNCQAEVIITSADSIIPGECPQEMTILRTWTADDLCGNTSTCVQSIFVQDTTPPTFNPACQLVFDLFTSEGVDCPAEATISIMQGDTVGENENWTVGGFTIPSLNGCLFDNCTNPDSLVARVDSIPVTGDSCDRTFTVYFTIIDQCGNESVDQFICEVNIHDDEAPVITCPSDVTINCEDSTSPDNTGVATAIDSCQLDVAITWTDSIIPGLCPQEMTILRTWVADDSCGNTSSCVQTIIVQDNTPPVITCPADVTVDCDAFVDLVVNGDFETMDFTGWSQINVGSGGIAINDGSFVPPSGDGPYPPCEGGSGAVTFQGGPGTHTLYQDITIPAGVASATLSWTDRIRNHYSEFVDPLQEFRVEVWNPVNNSVIAELFSTNPGDPLLNGCLNRAVDLTSYAGQTIRLAFTEQDAFFFFEVHLDAVQVLVGAATASTGIATAEDLCDTSVWVTFVDAIVPGECPQESLTTRTWTATDDCGNSSSCTQLITVQDTVAPVITCPLDLTIDCGESTSPDSTGLATGTDNCQDTVEITSTDVIVPGACPQEMTILRTWMAVDSCGNASTCVQAIEVQDTIPPTITCPANVTVQCASLVPPVNISSVSASDNCGETIIITHVGDAVTNMTCVNRFTLTRTYRATDECGNSATCNQVITVFDNTPPSITCPANVTVQCASQVPPVNTGSVTSTDNCGGTATITHVGDVITNMTCVNRFTLTRTYRATDECGNSATCNQVITVFDNTPPSITCPANITVQCANQVPAVNVGAVVTSDNCGGSVTVTHVGDVITNMTCVNRFILTRTYRATDACGNSATCAQVITVFDNTPPTLTCPANITVECASDVPPINTGSVVAADNCGGAVTITHVSDVVTNMTCLNRFTLTRTYRATDACGNSATCAQVITVYDDTPPVITFDDPLLEGVPNGGTIQVQCFGQDPEWEPPMLDEGSVDVTDNCAGTVTVVFTDDLIDEGDCDVDGYINRYLLTWVATDACGNTSSAFVFLELVDTIPPVIHNVPADVTVSCDEIPAPPTDVFATDECLCACIILFEETEPEPGCQDGQILTRTWTAEDDCGNITVEVQNITLIDNEGPEIILMVPELIGAVDGSVFEYTCNEGGIPEFFAELNAESVMTPLSCGTNGLVDFEDETIIANNCKFWGYIEKRVYTWEAVDDCGNTTSLTITALLIDTEPPVIVGAPDTTCIGDPSLDLVEVVDNCDNASLIYWDVRIPNPCGADEAILRTYEGYDDCGNTVRDTSILIPNDQSHPQMVFIDPVLAELEFGEILIVECEQQENGQYTPYGPGDVDFIDACMSGVTINFSENIIEAGDCTEGLVAVIELLWTATDLCGNLGEARIMAHVVDNTSPEFENFEVEITIDCGDELPEVFATDNCGEVVIETVDSIVPGPCVYEYDLIRTHTATDPCGNSTVRKQLIHVGDDNGPHIEGVVEEVCDDLSIPEVTAYDHCAGQFVEVTMVQDTLDVPCKEGMVIERIWTAVDACGHVSEVRQLIVLGDQTPPEIQIPTNSIIRRFYGYFNNLVFLSQQNIMDQLDDLNGSSVFVLDDCDQEIEAVFNLVVTYSEDCEEDGYFERRTYSWVATDICGNSDEVSFTVDIMDDIPPVIIGVPENTVIICADLPPVPVVTAEDPAQPVVIEYTQVIETGDGPTDFIVTRTWTATDACGNTSQETQKITWIPDTFLECDILLPGPVECNTHGVVIGSEVFGGLGEITYLWEVVGEDCFIQSGQNTPEIIIYIGWTEVNIRLTVTDAFGCSSVCSITLNCLDPFENNFVINPQIINPETHVAPSVPDNKDTGMSTLKHFNLWPNPANASVTISFESLIEDEVEYRLTNFLGQLVVADEMDAIKGYNSRKIDVSSIPDGAYLLQIMNEDQVYTKTIIIMRNE